MRRFLISAVCLIIGLGFSSAVRAGIQPRGPWTDPLPSPQEQPKPATAASTTPPAAASPAPKKPVQPPPNPAPPAPIPESDKLILVSLKDQTLKYFEGTKFLGEFKISSGIKSKPTPAGSFTVLAKKPVVNYRGPGYYYPKTKWNLQFKNGYYIHGAYWHNDFGKPRSHGCVNVSYANMEPLYDWADVGTKILIE